MSRFIRLMVVLLVTFLGFFFFPTNESGQSEESIAGMPVVCLGDAESDMDPDTNPIGSNACWLTLGAGTGVVVVGIGGFGVVSLTLYGVGLLFATGQLAAGGIAFGQAGFGLSFFLGQAGVAPVAMGQVVGGGLVKGQGALGADGGPFLQELSREVNALLGERPPGGS